MNLREIGLNRNEWDGYTAIEISCEYLWKMKGERERERVAEIR